MKKYIHKGQVKGHNLDQAVDGKTVAKAIAPLVYNSNKPLKGGKTEPHQRVYSCLKAKLRKLGIDPVNGDRYGQKYRVRNWLRALVESNYQPFGWVCMDEIIIAITDEMEVAL